MSETDSNITTDDVYSYDHSINTKNITCNKVQLIEKSLDHHEKISLVFLLYNDVEVAFQTLILLKNGSEKEVLTDWSKYSESTNPNWKNELIEALAIIQNYALLRKLGFDRNEIDQTFFPRCEYKHFFINPVKKLLYLFCDTIDLYKTQKLIYSLQTKFINEQLYCDSENLEVTILSLASKKIFSFNNLSPFVNILKDLEIETLKDELEKYCKRTHIKPESRFLRTSFCVDENVGYPEFGEESDLKFQSSATQNILRDINDFKYGNNSKSNNCYSINSETPGICLIINQENFYTEYDEDLQHLLPHDEKLGDRLGSEKDCAVLIKTFNAFNFKVKVENNKTHSELLTVIENVVKQVTTESSLIICILSHGSEGCVYGVNSIPVRITEIKEIICKTNIKNLRDKPKILILQACQGNKTQEVIKIQDSLEMDGIEAIAYADMLTFSATVPGFNAVRDKINGTWFIQSICKKLGKHSNNCHFEEICTLVKKDVINKRWGTKVMVPEMSSTLSKFFYLPSYVEK